MHVPYYSDYISKDLSCDCKVEKFSVPNLVYTGSGPPLFNNNSSEDTNMNALEFMCSYKAPGKSWR